MLKKELRNCLGILLRNGEKGVISGNYITTQSLNVYTLAMYQENLKHSFDSNKDIVAVYDTTEFIIDEILWQENEEDHFMNTVEELHEITDRIIFLKEILEDEGYADADPIGYIEYWQEYDMLVNDLKKKLKIETNKSLIDEKLR